VGGDPRARAGGPRRSRGLRDISHLYLSTSSRLRPAGPRPLQRLLRLGFAGDGLRLAKIDVCGNMAVQLARLGRRTLVVDLDPLLPNAGFQLGLEPAAYMAHLQRPPRPRLERGLQGLRLLEGVAQGDGFAWPAELQEELRKSDCVLFNLPALEQEGEPLLSRLGGLLQLRTESLNAAGASLDAPGAAPNAAGESPDAPGRAPNAAATAPLDALVYVHAACRPPARLLESAGRLARGRLHLVLWGQGQNGTEVRPWVRIRPDAVPAPARHPLSSLDPEHPGARLYEGLVQSLLAGCSGRGGADA
jgi:hypothetical protein